VRRRHLHRLRERAGRGQWEEGLVSRWWILDVDGERIVVVPQCVFACTSKDFETLTTMAESMTFTR
jgi:hypothetical protein